MWRMIAIALIATTRRFRMWTAVEAERRARARCTARSPQWRKCALGQPDNGGFRWTCEKREQNGESHARVAATRNSLAEQRSDLNHGAATTEPLETSTSRRRRRSSLLSAVSRSRHPDSSSTSLSLSLSHPPMHLHLSFSLSRGFSSIFQIRFPLSPLSLPFSFYIYILYVRTCVCICIYIYIQLQYNIINIKYKSIYIFRISSPRFSWSRSADALLLPHLFLHHACRDAWSVCSEVGARVYVSPVTFSGIYLTIGPA